MAKPVNVNAVLDGHVVLDVDCIDRMHLSAYVPNLQLGGKVVTFLHDHLGNEVPSPALFKPIGDRFRRSQALTRTCPPPSVCGSPSSTLRSGPAS